MQSVEVRDKLVEALRLDLVGPEAGSDLEQEVLPQPPSRWYLTGFLVPRGAGESQRCDEQAAEEIDALDEQGATDDAAEPEPRAAKRVYFPSSIGLSLLVAPDTRQVVVTVRWGDYKRMRQPGGGQTGSEESSDSAKKTIGDAGEPWRRTPRAERVDIPLPADGATSGEYPVPNSGGLKLVVATRPVNNFGAAASQIPAGTRSLAIFLVNARSAVDDEKRDEAFIFQAQLHVQSDVPFVARPNLRGLESENWDEKVADLQYRDAWEYAVGHGVATEVQPAADRKCREVLTRWIPGADVEKVDPGEIVGVEFSMEALAELPSAEEAQKRLTGIVTQYRAWIDAQRAAAPVEPQSRQETADVLLHRADVAARRIAAGIELLSDPMLFEAFRITNRVMARAARQLFGVEKGKPPSQVDPPAWRPFQLAFLLMTLPGIVDPEHQDREVVDLLFFPTGGGKTEAYLGLAAFTLVLRRLRHRGVTSAGVSVIMRYTLRLLTLDQLGRAATLICALELERLQDQPKLGPWPFEIGLWVGQSATPNHMGSKDDPSRTTARAKTIAFKNDDHKPSPIPLEKCPWCGTKFRQNSFWLVPNRDRPTDLRVECVNRDCLFCRGRKLPILAVDEPIYRRLPCFLIATVDKFAAMPWTGEVGAFFGNVDRAGKNGFYGACDSGGRGTLLEAPLLPPDLVIQDELHLISGPLGTIVGLFETALDALCTRELPDGKSVVRPKIVASTATVRSAEPQIQALFGRRDVDVFPVPGPDRRDSFFAVTKSIVERPGRRYLGIAAQGRSLKVVLLRVSLALLAAAQKIYEAEGGFRIKDNPADPYMTMLGYFNSLRELGGSRRIVEDEVSSQLAGYGQRRRVGQSEGLFAARTIDYEVVELTSRVNTSKVAEAKTKLGTSFRDRKNHVDVAMATNMISVGLDIVRLGLMVVLGQPKTCSEYIQATSRVGRDAERPGLVVTLLNIHRPRDRSHYERFAAYHESFYRGVEATSVTPFSPRALDRGLAGVTVALARHQHRPLTPPKGAQRIIDERGELDFVSHILGERAANHARLDLDVEKDLRQRVDVRVKDLLDAWMLIAEENHKNGVELQYQHEEGGGRPLLHVFLDPELKNLSARERKFCANRSMRDVEPSVNLWMRRLDELDSEEDRL